MSFSNQATAEANNLAAVAKSKDLYVTEMEKVGGHPVLSALLQFVCINDVLTNNLISNSTSTAVLKKFLYVRVKNHVVGVLFRFSG